MQPDNWLEVVLALVAPSRPGSQSEEGPAPIQNCETDAANWWTTATANLCIRSTWLGTVGRRSCIVNSFVVLCESWRNLHASARALFTIQLHLRRQQRRTLSN